MALFTLIALSTLALAGPILLAPGDTSFTEWMQMAGSVIAAVLITIGMFGLLKSRLHAYRWFERGILIDLLVTEVFAFYHSAGTALLGIAVDIALLIAIRMASRHEAATDQSLSTPSLLRLGL